MVLCELFMWLLQGLCVTAPQPRLPFIELQMIQCAANWKCFQPLNCSISLAAEVGKPPPTEPREILKMRLSEITDTYRCSLCQKQCLFAEVVFADFDLWNS